MSDYLLPPVVRDHQGKERKAGFEFEFGNLSVTATARELQAKLGGKLDTKSPFEAILETDGLGRLKVERDFELLRSIKYRSWLEALGVEFSPGSFAHEIETNIDSASKQLIPCEIVTDPIAFSELEKIDRLIEILSGIGAEGTQESLFYAFGLHINISLPDDRADTLKRYLQAFLLLRAWLIESSGTDITRRFFTKFIDPFPYPYMQLLVDNHYTPNMETLIKDYLTHNPTRNRALDMLPIFAGIEHDLVMHSVNEDERKLIKARPAFHFRLPDCRINVPGWSAASSWNQWVYVETLAEDKTLLQELITEWRNSAEKRPLAANTAWVVHLTTLLSEKFFADRAKRCNDDR